ncbi:MAG TPA: helicase-related protein [Anaerolineae bacterium]|nr:helicase-related protein [Anaerolineae bacterium]HQI86484.1 helicase-related protein [Anaerolineae bacterium]
MPYTVGSLVRARGREWVVLPESTAEWLVLRPLGGTDREIAGLYIPLEGAEVEPATFDLPDATRPGDFHSCRLLRDAVRLGFRSSAGPFRSFARLAVEPRPYQLVPLLMALRLDPVRLLIADDVGIGKTIEAGLIARELLDRGEVQRLAVLCPPHLAEQWQSELAEKFHIEAELVLASTAARLERGTAVGQSLFELHPFVIVSTEYIKSTRRREEFVHTCPELVIVDEAHTCAFSAENRGGRHLRHQLLQALAQNPTRHLLLVTATPHSGDEGAFRSLLALLRPEFARLPDDLTGADHEAARREVALHLVQRRRADVRAYMDADTIFPAREEAEATYTLSNETKKLFTTVLDYARERVMDTSGTQYHQRVRWWSALALLRSLASSPAAAAATLRTRSATVETENADEADLIGERAVLDLDDVDGEMFDVTPGADEGDTVTGGQGDGPVLSEAEGVTGGQRERLLRMARRAEALKGPQEDAKLRQAIELVKGLLRDGYQPILFCRFIPTAEYVAEELRAALPKSVEVAAVTGLLPPAEREQRVAQLGEHPQRVLVATDCLSEGINLQEHFTAVLHYDLSWNPTRHEQREGRVDRYGQASPTVRTITYYGTDNQIDGLVLDVLLRKHKTIRNSLGVSVPIPANTGEVVQALMQGLLLRGGQVATDGRQLSLFDVSGDIYKKLHAKWDNVTAREKQSRTLFAQRTLRVEDVAREWEAVRAAIGAGVDVQRFVETAVQLHGGTVVHKPRYVEIHLPNHAALREAVGNGDGFAACFELPAPEGARYLTRTHPVVEGLATYVLDAALDPLLEGVARRSGVIRTRAVAIRTTLLLLRLRYHLVTQRDGQTVELLAEDCQTVGFTGAPETAQWLTSDAVEALLNAEPAGNIAPQQATQFLERVLDGFDRLRPHLEETAQARGAALLEAHQRVRTAARLKGTRVDVRPHLPPDVLGIYVLLPAGQ